MTEAEEAFLLCLSLEQQERVQILLGERDLAVYTMQAERTLLSEERKNCDYLMCKLAEALKRAEAAEAQRDRYREVVELVLRRNRLMNPLICLDMLEDQSHKALNLTK